MGLFCSGQTWQTLEMEDYLYRFLSVTDDLSETWAEVSSLCKVSLLSFNIIGSHEDSQKKSSSILGPFDLSNIWNRPWVAEILGKKLQLSHVA